MRKIVAVVLLTLGLSLTGVAATADTADAAKVQRFHSW